MFVTASPEDQEQVQGHADQHKVGGPSMDTPNKITQTHSRDNVEYALVSAEVVRIIKLRQVNAGHNLDDDPK